MSQPLTRFLANASRRSASASFRSSVQNRAVRSFTSTSTLASASDGNGALSYDVIPKEDFGEYKEYSVIHTNRSLNLMSDPFQRVMRDLNALLKETYNADKVAIIPGSGTFGMEAVARQFAMDENVMVIRNGWFSYRWTEIFDMGRIPKSHTVLKAKPVDPSVGQQHYQYEPYPVDEVVAKIYEERPATLFCPHVETSTGIILPDDYIRKISAAMHDVGGLLVLDCIASGTIWADMKDLGVDVVISAPQKGWTGPCCAALVMMSERAQAKMETTEETSFAISLKRWSAIMDTYEAGGFGYHTTMPTDALRDFHEISVETLKAGLPQLKEGQYELGKQARAALDDRGLTSVAAPGFQAPGVLVYHSPSETENPDMMKKFKKNSLQIAMGVPWKLDEPEGMKTFRLGLFGLDKIGDISGTVNTMTEALDPILEQTSESIPEIA
eukprot:CAMPEP_0116117360 /NCGR_PEP_ID=MMETSP0329-20121206/1528_1 /TAXON_ID=697910 /ORGANISM="Pseudo-nitzschia arenysensis, Strain B593" /LENGTH=440 /DNA_ID=CAMNT_0003610913 /DNA_START=140 /DNA_END=1462 /DNA_ORIENTATION=+